MAPMMAVIKGMSFRWTPKGQFSFEEVKMKLIQAPVLTLPYFDKVFEVECDASKVGIGGVVTQEGDLCMLCNSRRKYSSYDKMLYAIVCYLST